MGQDCCIASGNGAYLGKSRFPPYEDQCMRIVNLDKLNACLTQNNLPLGCTVDGRGPPNAARSVSHFSVKALWTMTLLASSVVLGSVLVL